MASPPSRSAPPSRSTIITMHSSSPALAGSRGGGGGGGGTPGGGTPLVAGVPLKAVRYLTEAALELAGSVSDRCDEELVGVEMLIAAETLTAAATMVHDLLARAQRRLSGPSAAA